MLFVMRIMQNKKKQSVKNLGTYLHSSCRKHVLASLCLSVQLSVLKQCTSHWKDSCKVLYIGCLLIFGKTYQFWVKSNKSNRHFSWRLMSIYGILSLPVFIIEVDCVPCDVQSETEEAVDSLLFKTGNFLWPQFLSCRDTAHLYYKDWSWSSVNLYLRHKDDE